MRPPGAAYCRSLCSANSETIFDLSGLQVNEPLESRETIPGRTSISWPICRTPRRIEPPATPPFRSSTSEPGLFTSKDRITIKTRVPLFANKALQFWPLSGLQRDISWYSGRSACCFGPRAPATRFQSPNNPVSSFLYGWAILKSLYFYDDIWIGAGNYQRGVEWT